MCGQCGCDEPSTAPKRQRLELHQRLLSRNDSQAAHNRAHFQAHGLNAVNLLFQETLQDDGFLSWQLCQKSLFTSRGSYHL